MTAIFYLLGVTTTLSNDVSALESGTLRGDGAL